MKMQDMNSTQVTVFFLLQLWDSPTGRIVFIMMFTIIYILTFSGNLIIIIICRFEKNLHTPMYYFLSHLAALEMCYISVTVPKMVHSSAMGNSSISFVACLTQLYFFGSLGSTECFLLAIMGYDRFLAVCKPLHYHSLMTSRICNFLVVGTWVVGSIYGVIHTANTFRLQFCGAKVLNHYFCDILPLLKISCIDTYINELTVFAVGGFLMIGCFVLICGSYMQILFSVFSVPKGGGRMKAFSTCVSHLVVVLLFYGSGCFMYMRPKSNLLAEKEWLLSIFYTSITPLLNPIIYSLRNKDIRKALHVILNSHLCKFSFA
ncbi:unnamed protein product [Staurois parvus]|uniref:Olfactory receptor n=1 Tax=Staurois parvus TaxID=386267 RepID=A0ABN9F0T4_9NEOB|nr:unnamed protein product [Staurois parvus]